jgi:hypothetical protein
MRSSAELLLMMIIAVVAHEINCTSCSPQFVGYVWVHVRVYACARVSYESAHTVCHMRPHACVCGVRTHIVADVGADLYASARLRLRLRLLLVPHNLFIALATCSRTCNLYDTGGARGHVVTSGVCVSGTLVSERGPACITPACTGAQ